MRLGKACLAMAAESPELLIALTRQFMIKMGNSDASQKTFLVIYNIRIISFEIFHFFFSNFV
jgi:hypothetical protein